MEGDENPSLRMKKFSDLHVFVTKNFAGDCRVKIFERINRGEVPGEDEHQYSNHQNSRGNENNPKG
jgi:hypothetical protein